MCPFVLGHQSSRRLVAPGIRRAPQLQSSNPQSPRRFPSLSLSRAVRSRGLGAPFRGSRPRRPAWCVVSRGRVRGPVGPGAVPVCGDFGPVLPVGLLSPQLASRQCLTAGFEPATHGLGNRSEAVRPPGEIGNIPRDGHFPLALVHPWTPVGAEMSSGPPEQHFREPADGDETGPWPCRFSTSPSSESSSWCSSVDATATSWPLKSSCSDTRLPCSVVRWSDRPSGLPIEPCSPD